jgi:hypothetical protein
VLERKRFAVAARAAVALAAALLLATAPPKVLIAMPRRVA